MDLSNTNSDFSVNKSYNSEAELLGIQRTDCEKAKIPRKTLHFCDGTIDEYSTDEEDLQPKIESLEIDTKTLSWGKWVGYWTVQSGKLALDTCDSVGGSLANFFGITSPKYFYEIEEYNRIVQEESEEKKETDKEMTGWSSPRNEEVSTKEIYKISTGADLTKDHFSPETLD